MKNLVFILFLFIIGSSKGQISVVNLLYQGGPIVPYSLLECNILSSNTESATVIIESKLSDDKGDVLLTVRSGNTFIHSGLNLINTTNTSISKTVYGSNIVSSRLKATGKLAGGNYRLCVTITSSNVDIGTDEFCDDFEQENEIFINLINPMDDDTVYTKYPLLSWNHNELFSNEDLSTSYRLIVCKMDLDQSPEAALISNPPILIKDFLKTHLFIYPMQAKELLPNNSYAWKVQKLYNGQVVVESESWKFNLEPLPQEYEIKYGELLKSPGQGFYSAFTKKIFFKYEDKYNSSGLLNYQIFNEELVAIDLKPNVEYGNNTTSTIIKSNGDNRYEMDLNSLALSSGYYTLIIKNEKSENFYLKFYIDK